jgi:metallo-beta-lactamase class B
MAPFDRKRRMRLFALLFAGFAAAAGAHDFRPVKCPRCEEWNQPQAPFRIYGNTYYVGTSGLSALLVTGPQGHVLLDAALPQSAPQIAANIRALGFKVEDIALIVNSHPHYDHSGGIAEMQYLSGARVVASAASAAVLLSGLPGPDDPQYHDEHAQPAPKVDRVDTLRAGETQRIGSLALTPLATPGHTPGGTTWTWQSCEGGRCLNIVFGDSLNPISDDIFHFSDSPGRVAAFQAGIAAFAALPCDILIAGHPEATDTMERLKARDGNPDAFIDPQSCREYAARYAKKLDARLEAERKEKQQSLVK